MSNYADWSNNFGNKYTPYLESDNEDVSETNVQAKGCSPGCNCSKHTETFSNMSITSSSNMSCSNNCNTNNCVYNKTIKRTQLNPTINELDAMYKNIMPPLQIETFENTDKKNKESFKNMGPKLVDLNQSISIAPVMVLPQQKSVKETFENTSIASTSPSSMMMGFTRPMETNENKLIEISKENFSNTVMDMGIQLQKQEPTNSNINMDMSYSNNEPSMMSASMMTPPPIKKNKNKNKNI